MQYLALYENRAKHYSVNWRHSTWRTKEVMGISDEQAIIYGRRLAREEGLLLGISSGADLAAAIEIGKREENRDRLIVVVQPSVGERYLSTPLFQNVDVTPTVPVSSNSQTNS